VFPLSRLGKFTVKVPSRLAAVDIDADVTSKRRIHGGDPQ